MKCGAKGDFGEIIANNFGNQKLHRKLVTSREKSADALEKENRMMRVNVVESARHYLESPGCQCPVCRQLFLVAVESVDRAMADEKALDHRSETMVPPDRMPGKEVSSEKIVW